MKKPAAPIFSVEYENMGNDVFVAVRSPGGSLIHRHPVRDDCEGQEKVSALLLRLAAAPEGNAKSVIERFFGIGWEEMT